jgi:hypothetical protein
MKLTYNKDTKSFSVTEDKVFSLSDEEFISLEKKYKILGECDGHIAKSWYEYYKSKSPALLEDELEQLGKDIKDKKYTGSSLPYAKLKQYIAKKVSKDKTFSPNDGKDGKGKFDDEYYIVEVMSRGGDTEYKIWNDDRIYREFGTPRPYRGMSRYLPDSKLTIKDGPFRSKEVAEDNMGKHGYVNQGKGGKEGGPRIDLRKYVSEAKCFYTLRNELDLYKAYIALKDKRVEVENYRRAIAALSEAAEGANVHRLVERISRELGIYWNEYVGIDHSSRDRYANLEYLKEARKNPDNKYMDEFENKFKGKVSDQEAEELAAKDYPEDYSGKGKGDGKSGKGGNGLSPDEYYQITDLLRKAESGDDIAPSDLMYLRKVANGSVDINSSTLSRVRSILEFYGDKSGKSGKGGKG